MSGLVGAWTFDDGTANDSSGNGNHGVVNGATPTIDRDGNPNQAFEFDGTDDFISIAGTLNIPAGNDPYTVSLWACIDDLSFDLSGDNSFLFSRGAESVSRGQHITLRTSGNIGLTHWANDAVTSYVASIAEWFNVTVTFDGATEKLYINGDLEWTSTNFTLGVDNSSGITLGRHVNFPILFFDGKIDDVYVYDRVLSSAEIQQLVPIPAALPLLVCALTVLGFTRRTVVRYADGV